MNRRPPNKEGAHTLRSIEELSKDEENYYNEGFIADIEYDSNNETLHEEVYSTKEVMLLPIKVKARLQHFDLKFG
jgi:predicted hydrolase (HD superfamily)